MMAHVLLTGVTGFVGKVVLHELLRRSQELGIGHVSVIVREKKSRSGVSETARDRFESNVVRSKIWKGLSSDWQKQVSVVSGDLEQPDLGLSEADRSFLQANVTHILHCAASVEFDLPLTSALRSNVDAALNMLELARGSARLAAMVSVSTAYVSVWRNGPMGETLGHLPRPAAELKRCILEGTRTDAELLAESGHPNTYTYTKCLAEHLLVEKRGDVPLVIVRPSIISAAWAEPEPGWIDSTAAFAGCLLYTGLGLVRVWEANPNVRLDVVPVDVVSRRVIDAAFDSELFRDRSRVPIRLAVMGLRQAMRADFSTTATARFFDERPGAKAPPGVFIGGKQHGFLRQDLLKRALPMGALSAYFALARKEARRRQVRRIDERVKNLNLAFRYFIHHTFDFRPSVPVSLPGFSPAKYIDIVNRGMYRHLLGRDETELTLAGARHDDPRSDLRWAFKNPEGAPVIRALGVALRKALRRSTTMVTFDRTSFERAVSQVAPGRLLVLAPSHRSYFDFLLSSYLCFQHPELGVPVPRIAAAEEFSRIPLVSRILTRSGAFYVRRGVGKAAPEISSTLEKIAADRESLMFFIEGQRSRGRRVLPPKRGLLRALQATSQQCAVLPIAISYERVPEESAFDRELRGGKRSSMSLEAIVRWLWSLARGDVQLGRVHIACGQPLLLDASSDVQAVAREVAAELQRKTVVSTFHLRMFLTHSGVVGVDLATLTRAIEARGGRVLASETPLPEKPAASLLRSLENQWMHWFYPDALQSLANHRAVRDHVTRNAWATLAAETRPRDPSVDAVVRALFQPVIRAYDLVTEHVTRAASQERPTSPASLVQVEPWAHLPHLEDAFRALSDHGILREIQPGHYAPVDGMLAWSALGYDGLGNSPHNGHTRGATA